LPDLSGGIGTNVSTLENSLRTLRNDQAMMSQEVVSLLLFGRFAPISGLQQANGSANINSGINNTISDIVSAQANNLVSKILPGVDFNVDIQTANNSEQRAQAILSASRKFLNERWEVRGSYDVYSSNNNIMSQYNLTKDGNLRIKAYNKTTTTIDPNAN